MQKTTSIFTMADFKGELRKDQYKAPFAVTMPTEKQKQEPKQKKNKSKNTQKPNKRTLNGKLSSQFFAAPRNSTESGPTPFQQL